jgi:polo-like kinase 4
MSQVVTGLLYLHSHGILHRDLTLANLLLTRDMNVVSTVHTVSLNDRP